MADNMNVTVRDPLAPRRQMPPIVIGRAGEYGATTVTFDLRGLIDRYGAGVPTLLHKRPPDDEAYIVPPSAADTETHDRTEMPDSETLVWHVGKVATSYVGNGKIELQWHPDGAAKKSAQFDVVVLGTIGNPVSEIPDAQQIYLDVMQGIADDAEDAADRAEEATEHYPKIVNGNWYVWDVTNSEWVDTGFSARGPAGDKGDPGFSPEIRSFDIQGGHRVDLYNETGYESFNVMDGIDGTDGTDGEDGVSPTVAVTDIAGGHRVTITDATHPQGQSFAVMNGSGISEDVKVALLNCFENVAWINDDGQTFYDALYAALYPPADVLSISAVFTQGSAVIYDTDDLDTLKQFLVVTAAMSDSTTQTVTNYTLSGTLAEGTSTITVSYSGKTDTFNVTVTLAVSDNSNWVSGVKYTLSRIQGEGASSSAGTITQTSSYDRTDYGYCEGADYLYIPNEYNGSWANAWFYDSAKTYISPKIAVGTYAPVPSNARYFVFSKSPATFDTVANDIVPFDASDFEVGWSRGVAYSGLTLFPNQCLKYATGAIQNYAGWSLTYYVNCDGVEYLRIPAATQYVGTDAVLYNWFYDENKAPLSRFAVSKTDENFIIVPQNAKYFILNFNTACLEDIIENGVIPYMAEDIEQ